MLLPLVFLCKRRVCRRIDGFLWGGRVHLLLLRLFASVKLVGFRCLIVGRWLLVVGEYVKCVKLLLYPELGGDLLKLPVAIV
jgi:hypothetical protein